MKKELLKSSYRLQILNDGSSLYFWVHPWKSRFLVRSKDISSHSFWDQTKKSANSTQVTHLQKYTRSFLPKVILIKK